MSPRLELIIPGLCGPLPEHVRDQPLDDVDELASVLGKVSDADESGYLTVLASRTGIEPLPVAALSLYASAEAHVAQYCMSLELVHLKADMDHALMVDNSIAGVTDNERSQLLEELNAHFSEDAIVIFADADNNWFITQDDAFGITTSPVEDVIARNVNLFMPTGDAAMAWKRFMNESQMLLYQSEVNQRREQSGLLPLNSLWPVADRSTINDVVAAPHEYDLIVADNSLCRGVARLTDTAYQRLDDFDVATVQQGSTLICDNSMLRAAANGDLINWNYGLRACLDNLLNPLAELARQRRIELTVSPCAGKRYRIQPRRLLAGLFKPRPEPVICYGD